MEQKKELGTVEKELALETIITSAIQIPGVKVNRKQFLADVFANEKNIQEILDIGPIEAGITQENLARNAGKLILIRTSQSSIASFVAGIPGGLALAATIPADVLQFFGMSLRLAQELSYLYGGQDLWQEGHLDDERVRNQLILYCGVMFGVSGAVSSVRVLSSQLAKVTLKKLPQQALTKTFWYPIIKQIGKMIGVKVTKSTVAKGVSSAIPLVGGVISGGLNFASMMPMANRLQSALDKAVFQYTEEDFDKDMDEIENFANGSENTSGVSNFSADVKEKGKKAIENISGLFSRRKEEKEQKEDPIEAIKKLSELKDCGAITQEEFDTKKAELLQKI